MPQAVAIQISVEDNGAVAAIGQQTQALEQLGAAGSAAGAHIDAGMRTAGGHFQTNLDSVRLLSQEFGLRLPRALESMISRMPMLTNAIGGATGALAGFAFAEVFLRGAEAIYNAEQKYISITSAADKYNDTLQKISEHDFTNTRDLATTAMRLREATEGAKGLPQAAQQLSSTGWRDLIANPTMAIPELLGAHNIAGMGARDMERKDSLSGKSAEQMHEQALAAIELAHAKDALLQKDQQANAEAEKQIAITAENRSFATSEEKRYGNPVDPLAGQQEDYTKNQMALSAAAVKNQEEAAQESLSLVKAQSEARQAGLGGEALYVEKQKDAVRELHLELAAQRELVEYGARKAALEAQYDAERQKRVRELTAETQKMEEDSKSSGLTGAAKIIADRDQQMAAIDAKQKSVSGGAPLTAEQSNDFDRQRAVVAANSYRELNKLEDDYTSHVQEQSQQRADALLSGYAKVDAAAAREKTKLQDDFDKSFGGANLDPAQAAAAQQALADAKAGVDADAQAQRQQIAQRNHAEDLQYDQQAAAAESRVRAQGATGMVSAYRNAMTEIQAQEDARMAKLQDDAQKEGLTWQEVANRRADIEREANADIAEQNQHMVQSLAGELQSAFDNPMKFFKEKAEKAMFEIIANWMMQTQLFKGFFGNTLGGLQPGGSGASGASPGGILQQVFGAHGAPAGTAGVIPGGTYLPTSTSSGGVSAGSGSASDASSPITAVLGARSAYSPTQSGEDYSGTASSSSSGAGYSGGYSSTVATPSAVFPNSAHTGTNAVSSAGSLLNGGNSLLKTLGLGGAQASAASAGGSDGYTGEDGGFAGSITGDTEDMGAGYSDPSSVGSIANQQASGAMQSVAGGVGAGGALAGVMGFAGGGMAAYQGVEGVMSSFHKGGVSGALSGAMSGAEAGAAIGSIVPGIGTLVGGVIGGIAGLTTNLVGQAMGETGKFAARDYYKQTLYPELEGVRTSFMNGGGGDYLSAMSEANRDSASGMDYMTMKWGPDAAAYVHSNYLQKELNYVTGTIERMARGGAQYTGRAAAEFHSGGLIGGFGDLATTGSEGYIHAMMGEGITNVPATQMHGAAIQKMNDGATPADMASHFLQAGGAGTRAASGGGGGDTHLHVHTMDTKTMTTWLRNGGAKMITSAQNAHVATYGGSASNG